MAFSPTNKDDHSIQESILPHVIQLSKERRDLNGTNIPILLSPPTAIEFAKFISRNQPFVIKSGCKQWPALEKWRHRDLFESYFRDIDGNNVEITVASTPNGLADAVVEGMFCLPYESEMTMPVFLDMVTSRDDDAPIVYIQSQNDNLNNEFNVLLKDVEEFGFAREYFGQMRPDAMNLWIGNRNSMTSFHKDHYENLYAMIKGSKTFTLIPPNEYPFLYEGVYPTGMYKPINDGALKGEWIVERLEPEIKTPWIPILYKDGRISNSNRDSNEYPMFREHCRPIRVTIEEGDVLYLPSLWYHQVEQDEGITRDNNNSDMNCVIAVNYWYDMEYDGRYAYYEFIRRMWGNMDK